MTSEGISRIIQQAVVKYGMRIFELGRVHEYIDLDSIVKSLSQMPPTKVASVLEAVASHDENYETVVSSILNCVQDWPDEKYVVLMDNPVLSLLT